MCLALPNGAFGDHPPFQRMDVFELEWASEPAISPDGKKIVFVRKSMDIMQDAKASRLWLINSDGSDPVPLTGADVNESGAAWSHDGARIAYVRSSDHGAEIYVHWLADGKSTRLTQLDRSPSGLRWSPDDRRIAFAKLVPEDPPVLVTPPRMPKGAVWADPPRVTTRLKHESDGSGHLEPGYQQFFVISAIGGSPRQISEGAFRHVGAPEWTTDGKALIVTGNRNPDWERAYQNLEIYELGIDTREVRALTERNGPDENPLVSPDGKYIAWLSFADKVQTFQLMKLHVMNRDGSGKREVLGDFDRSIDAIQWNGQSNGIFYQYDDQGDTKIGLVRLNGKSQEVAGDLGGEAVGRPYGGGSFSVAGNNRIAYTHSTPYRPAELAVVNPGGKPQVITSLNDDLLPYRTLGEVQEIWYASSVDERKIQGWIVTPPDYDKTKRYPLLVENHGGPVSNYGPRFSPEIQLYAAAGYVVFYPNPRGSTGYGEEFGNLLYNNYPGDDYQDVMDGVDTLIRQGIAAEGNLYVTGGSAGGIMSAWMIGKNNRFRAAAVVKPVMNWISKTLTADNYYGYANYRYPGQPWENIETYMKFSPVSLVGNIQTPTLVMVGTADLRTPLSEAKQLYHALKIRDIDTALVEVPDAPHFIAGRPSQLITKIDHILAWFDKYKVSEEQ